MIRNPLPRILVSFVLFPILVLAGCVAGRKADLEGAELVPVSLAGEGALVPPPRHIDDITALLSSQAGADSTAVTRLKAAAGVPAASLEKAQALWELGRYHEAAEVLRTVLAEGAGNEQETGRAMLHLAKARIESGDFREGMALLEQLRGIALDSRRMAGWQAGMYSVLVNACRQVGRFDQAKAIGEEALRRLRSTPREKGRARALPAAQNMENIRAALLEIDGRFKEAEPHIRAALAALEGPRERWPVEAIVHRLWLARNLLVQERFLDAEIEARRALRDAVAQAGTGSGKMADAAQVLGQVILAQGRLADARRLAEAVIAILVGSGYPADSFEISKARVFLGNVLTAMGEYAGAAAQYNQARASMGDNAFFRNRLLGGNPSMALSLIESGQGAEVTDSLTRAFDTARQRLGEGSYQAAEFLALKAAALARTGRLEEAAKAFGQAMPVLMGRDLGEDADVGRVSRLRAIVLEYIGVMDAIQGKEAEKRLGIDAAAAAFQAAELWSGRSVRQALAASSARSAADAPGLGELVRQEQDAGNRLQVVQGVLLNLVAASGDQQSPEDAGRLAQEAAELEKTRAILRDEIIRRFPKYADFVSPAPPRAETAQGVLRQGETLVVFIPGPDRLYVLALSGVGRTRLASVRVGSGDLEDQVASLRRSLDIHPATLGDIPAYDTALAGRLHATLFGPIEAEVANAPALLIVAGGPLARLPFPALLTAQSQPGPDRKELFDRYRGLPWLVQRSAVTMLPSVSSLVMLRGLPRLQGERKPLIGFADPYFAPGQAAPAGGDPADRGLDSRGGGVAVRGVRGTQRGNLDSAQVQASSLEHLERLPDTRQEILAIAEVLGANPAQDVFLGEKASRVAVKQADLADRRVVVFATHALVPGDLDGLDQPALALSAPSVTGRPEDGLLTMDDVLRLKLNADWVTLSACNTAAAQGAGAEAASGLGRAFFYAGARALLVSQWAVESTSAARLSAGLFEAQRRQPGLTRAMALRQSMLELINGQGIPGGTAACYAHPFFWAPFAIIGDPGGET